MKALLATLMLAAWVVPLAAAAQKPAAMTKTYQQAGTIVSITDTSLVLSSGKLGVKKETTFVLNPETKREGTLANGDKATVSYRMEGKDRIATLVQVPQAKAMTPAKTKKSGY